MTDEPVIDEAVPFPPAPPVEPEPAPPVAPAPPPPPAGLDGESALPFPPLLPCDGLTDGTLPEPPVPAALTGEP